MKKTLCLLLALLTAALLLAGCAARKDATTAGEATTAESAADGIPQDLVGVWVSANTGEDQIRETITFNDDGTMSASAEYRGQDAGTISGTFTVKGSVLTCDIDRNASGAFTRVYTFAVDGRELTLDYSKKGPVKYLRVS